MVNIAKQLELKYLTVDTPFGVVNAKNSDLNNIRDLINSTNDFNDFFRLADNTFTVHEITKVDLIIIKDIILAKRNAIKKELWN